MKLRTKLLLPAALLFLLIFTLSVGGMLLGSVRSAKALLTDTTGSECRLAAAHFRRQMEDGRELRGLSERSRAEFVFRQISLNQPTEASFVLLRADEILQNDSGVSVTPTAKETAGMLRVGGVSYCLAKTPCTIGASDYTVAVVRNTTRQMDAIRTRSLRAAVLALGLLFAGLAGLLVLIRFVLRPIPALADGAAAIADGDYGRRIPIKSRDELGALSAGFNRMAEAVQTHVRQVEQKEKEQRLLLRAIWHETRTPVTAISGFAYALRHAELTAQEQDEALDFIAEESLRLERLTVKLTELITASSCKAEKKPVALEPLAERLSALLPDLPGLSIQASGTASGDADLLLSFLTNVCDNARKAHAASIQVELSPTCFRVTDDGDGIPASALPHVTEPMFQADPSRHTGFGLGLSLCRSIAVLHGGSLQIESAEGRGTTVRLILPA